MRFRIPIPFLVALRARVAPDGGYAMDGGVVETTGIAALLRTRASTIVAFYNNNDNLNALNATFAFLFGVDGTTDNMNSLEGPTVEQVFPSALYPEVIANLTDSTVQRAHLTQVSVQANSFLGIEAYTLDHLYILSLQRSDAFLAGFQDKRVEANVADGWPNEFGVGMDTFNANMLCLYSQWKLRHFAAELSSILG